MLVEIATSRCVPIAVRGGVAELSGRPWSQREVRVLEVEVALSLMTHEPSAVPIFCRDSLPVPRSAP
jgi:hypothetical protein